MSTDFATDANDVATTPFVVQLEGFEGPLDVLLALARQQKVDLRQISILELAEQYLEFVTAARRADLDLAAEYLVMAAWLAFLKSRALLPVPTSADEPSADEMADALAQRLRRLAAMQDAGAKLMSRPQLGTHFFTRGAPEGIATTTVTFFTTDLYELLTAYGRQLHRQQRKQAFKPPTFDLYSIDQVVARMRRMLGYTPDWHNLSFYLPDGMLEESRRGTLRARSAVASTFVACLELVREGAIVLKQVKPFGPMAIRVTDSVSRPD